MSLLLRSAILLVLLASTTGCTDSPREGRKLVPVMTERGILTYRYEDETPTLVAEAPTSSGFVPSRPPQLVSANRRGDDQVWQEILEHRRNLNDQITRDRQARQDEQASRDREQSVRWERDRLTQQASREQQRNQIAERRSNEERAARDEAARQQRQDESFSRLLQQQNGEQERLQRLEQLRQSGSWSR